MSIALSQLRRAPLLAASALAAAGLFVVLRPPLEMPAEDARVLALALAAIAGWATGVLPGHVVALGFFALATLTGAAPAAVVFSGFQSSAYWLIFGGLVLGVAVRRSGLGPVLAARLTALFGATYAGTIAGMVGLGVALSFVMPSALGRTTFLMPIAAAVADRLGFAERSAGRTGIVLAAAFGTQAPSFAILPANVPNAVLAASAEALFGQGFSYGAYLLLHFPVLGFLKAVAIVLILARLFRDTVPATLLAPAAGPLTPEQRRVALVLAVALALWASDSLHHLPPAWIGLAAAVACFLPPWRLVPPAAIDSEMSHGALLHVAGLIGLGAVVAASGLGARLAGGALALLPLDPAAPLANVAILAGLTMTVALLTTLPGAPAVLTPLSPDLAAASGLPVEAVLMAQVLGFSTVLLPYQAPPLVVALHMAKPPAGALLRFWAALTGTTLLVLLPLDLLWWRLLGVA